MGGRSFCVRVSALAGSTLRSRFLRGSVGRVSSDDSTKDGGRNGPGLPKNSVGRSRLEEKESTKDATGNCEVVQRREGFRVHCTRGRLCRRVRPLHGNSGGRASAPLRRTKGSSSRSVRAPPRDRRPLACAPSDQQRHHETPPSVPVTGLAGGGAFVCGCRTQRPPRPSPARGLGCVPLVSYCLTVDS